MRYGILFCALAFLIAYCAIAFGGWFLVLMWPACSVAIVGLAYIRLGPGVFGKRPDGTLNPVSTIVLLPFLLCLWSVWHLLRLGSQERPFDTVAGDLFISRRLLSSELPAGINTVVDLTAEFTESKGCRSVPNFIAAPMLDDAVLPDATLAELATRLTQVETPLLIHCAQGHGRTGLVSALVLIARGEAVDASDALQLLQASRPLLRLNSAQMVALEKAATIILNHQATPRSSN